MLQNVAGSLVPGRMEGEEQTAPGATQGSPQVCCAQTCRNAGVKVCTPFSSPWPSRPY